MNEEEINRGFEFLSKDTGDKEKNLKDIYASLLQEAKSDLTNQAAFHALNQPVFHALDRELDLEGGGYAFLWQDIIEVGGVVDVLLASGLAISPSQHAKVVMALLRSWQKLRKVRIELSEDQFKVILAVKRGKSDISSICSFTGIEEQTVSQIVNDLKNIKYQESINLLEVDVTQGIVTKF